jgi:hypothetical protein
MTTNRLLMGLALAGITAASVAAPAVSVAAPRTALGAWAVVAAPSPGPVQNTLFGIARMPHDGVWAVGDRVSTSSPRFIAPLVEHWTGSRWVAHVLPGHQTNLLAAYSPAHNDLWAVGFFRVGIGAFETVPVIDHFNGQTWTIASAPDPAASVLTGIGGTSAADIWASRVPWQTRPSD